LKEQKNMRSFIGNFALAAAFGVASVVSVQAVPQAAPTGNQSNIDARISQRLKADPELKEYNIKVVVSDGVATLSGTVTTKADRAKAGSLAKVEGVNRVDNQIVVDLDAGTTGTTGRLPGRVLERGVSKTGEAITDGWITTRIKAAFVDEDLLKNSAIDVHTKGHVVTLSGTVATAAGRARAVGIAKGTDGVKNVIDKLTIGPKK
jgi:hyperosmotically inducible periplasmic protein